MTMRYCVQIGDPHPDMERVEETIRATFAEVNTTYNNWNPDSEVSKLNALLAYEKVEITENLSQFLERVIQLTAFTEGRFDPAFGEAFHLEKNLFWKEKNATKLDLGGVAKGYGVDLILERLQESGFHNIYVEWGGEIRVAGRHPANRPWKIAILGGEEMELNDEAIATSGSYQQNWMIDGVLYTHITDPHTNKPLANPPITSASVRTLTCMEADAVATALMLIPSIKEAEEWATQKGLAVWLR